MSAEGSRTLEVRWISPGRLPRDLLAWLGPFGDEVEDREDRYLVEPASADLGVKIKGGIQLDLKVRREGPGTLVVPGGEGRLEVWEKWSFPLVVSAIPPVDASSWVTLEKIRHRRSFRAIPDGIEERPVEQAEEPGCTVELTEVTVGGDAWWTLALEACGEPATLDAVLRATAETIFARPLPDDVSLDLDRSVSYAAWLGTRRRSRPGDVLAPA